MKECPHCHSNEFEYDPSRSDTICMNCGAVLAESSIVAEVSFQENAAGGSSVIGAFVPTTGVRGLSQSASAAGGRGPRSSLLSDTRALSQLKGKRIIRRLADTLNLSKTHTEQTQLLYNLALAQNFVRGRTSELVVGACVYIICRRLKTSHMLLDVSDALQVDVFKLGRVFLGFSAMLKLELPVVDPSLYIQRFASSLSLGEDQHQVVKVALRLVSRMKRDWIQAGRHPAGICGACLLISARLHGFQCSVHEISHIVRIQHQTISKRLNEFVETPSSQLTLDEFQNSDLAVECDPPSFKDDEIEKEIEEQVKQIPDELVSSSAEMEKGKKSASEDELGSDLDDDEIGSVLLSKKESFFKQKMWNSMHKEYLKDQEMKKRYKELDAPIKRKNKKTKPNPIEAETTEESISQAMKQRSGSSKINQMALQGMFLEHE